MINTVEQSYNLNDIENERYADSYNDYNEYESAVEEWSEDEPAASRRWTVWHLVLLLVLLIIVAAVIVYVVLPFVVSLTPAPIASQLPTPVQA